MTGFGRGASGGVDQAVTVEIRSVNHRYRDVIVRMPRTMQVYEDDVRGIVGGRLSRGRVEVAVTMAGNGQEAPLEIEVNVGLLRSYVRAMNRIREELSITEGLDLNTVMGLKDVLTAKPRDVDIEGLRGAVMDALFQALDGLDAMRIAEGKRLEDDLSGRLETLHALLDQMERRTHGAPDQRFARLMEDIQRLLQDSPADPQRLAQEAAILADRADVSEEIFRIKSHLEQFRQYMSLNEPVGRRLDFLLQELHREVNTLGVKASDAAVSASVVEFKAELEKIREQVQNVE
jgi:uncharacterized protein (TIGR00255 family)